MTVLDRSLYLTADKSEVVEEGDARAAFLLGNAGTEIPDDEAARLGIAPKKSVKKASEPANKAAKAAENK